MLARLVGCPIVSICRTGWWLGVLIWGRSNKTIGAEPAQWRPKWLRGPALGNRSLQGSKVPTAGLGCWPVFVRGELTTSLSFGTHTGCKMADCWSNVAVDLRIILYCRASVEKPPCTPWTLQHGLDPQSGAPSTSANPSGLVFAILHQAA